MNTSSDGRGLTQWKYSGTIIGGFCAGPLRRLRRIEVGNEVVWEGSLDRLDSPNPVTITIPDRGDIEFYWGTEDQVLASWFVALAASEFGHVHPDYRGTSFGILRDFVFGVGVLSPPNLRFSGEREPVQALITGAATELVDGQANPYVVLAEALTHPLIGLAHPASLFDAGSWQASADALIPRAAEVYVSLMVDSQVAARKVGANLLAMADGWLRAKRGAGTIEAGLFPPPESIVLAMLDKIDFKNSGEKLISTPETYDDVKTTCIVRFKDRDELFKSRSRKYSDPRARQAGLKPAVVELDLPIVRPEQAQTQANLIGRYNAMPRSSHVASVRSARFADLQAGDHVLVDIDPTPGGAQLFQPSRVVSITRPMVGALTINLESVPTLAPLAYVPAVVPVVPPGFTVPPVEMVRLFELAPQAADGQAAALGLLVERPHEFVTELYVYYDSLESEGAVYPRLASAGSYALRGEIAAGIGIPDTTVVVTLQGTLDREILDGALGGTAARNDELLLIVVGPLVVRDIGGVFQYDRKVEVTSVVELAITATNEVTATVFRARQGTQAITGSVGGEAWFVRRAALPWFRHADFEARAESGDNLYFKLQPATPLQAQDLAEIDPITFRYNTSRSFAPAIVPASPDNDIGQEFVAIALGEVVSFNGYVSDSDGDLSSISVSLMTNGAEEVYFYREYGGVEGISYATSIRFPESGIFSVIIRATDLSGRVQQYTHSIHCAVSLTSRCAEPSYTDTRIPQYWTPSAPGANSVLWYNQHMLRFRCASMQSEGGPSSTVKILTAFVPVGAPLESVTSWDDHAVNTSVYINGGSEERQVAVSPMHQAERFRIWVKAVDTTATLADSFPFFVDAPVVV